MFEETNLEVTYPNVKEYDTKTRLLYEKEVLGVYISGHPLEGHIDAFKKYGFSCVQLADYEEDDDGNRTYPSLTDGQPVTMGGMIGGFSKKTTKTGQSMAIVTVEDVYGSIEAVMFPKVYDKYKDRLENEAIVEVSGKLQIREGEKPNIVVDKIELIKEKEEKKTEQKEPIVFSAPFTKNNEDESKPKKTYYVITLNGPDEACQTEILEILTNYPGDVPVYFVIDGVKFNAHYKIRRCKGLYFELCTLIDGENIKYIEK